MAKTTYIVRHNGTVVGTRKSDRTYTHAIVCAQTSEAAYSHGKPDAPDAPHVAAFCGRLDLARAQVAKLAPYFHVVEIVPVEIQAPKARRKPRIVVGRIRLATSFNNILADAGMGKMFKGE
jgi:hypothetical protein